VTVSTSTGLTTDRSFGVQLEPGSLPQPFSCTGAERTVGPCCFYRTMHAPGMRRVTDPAGPPPNAGPITLVDTTSKTRLGVWDYVTTTPGGYGLSVLISLAENAWNPGDVLTVSAAGADGGPGVQLSAFTASAPTLVPPSAQFPSSIPRTENLEVTWQPDPNASTMNIGLSDNLVTGSVYCAVPDAQGKVSMDGSLITPFPSGALQLSLARETDRVTQPAAGVVFFQSLGLAYFQTSLN
jgi:hypothetical protein